jgi:hypothetical protein
MINPVLVLPVKPVQLQHMVIARLRISRVLSYLPKHVKDIRFY